jgi:hypothetical protein
MKSPKDYIFSKLIEFALAGGKSATKEHYEARLEICKACPHYGQVQPIPMLHMDGCTLCGCPAATKPKYLTLPRLKDNVDTPLSIAELLQLKTNFSNQDFVDAPVKCSDKANDRWAEVDSKFS